MPLFEEKNTHPNNQATDQLSQTPKKEFNLVKTIGQLLPLAPFVFEQFTGQKVPPMTGTMAEMQTALIGIQNNLQSIDNNQQELAQRIIVLETKLSEIQNNANNHLTNLTHQFNSLRLTNTIYLKQL